MNRRTVLSSAGVSFVSCVAGCLSSIRPSDPGSDDDSSEENDPGEENREIACSHFPEDADQLEYETGTLRHDPVPLLVDGKFRDVGPDEGSNPFALITSPDDIEMRLQLDALDDGEEDHASVQTFIEETNFETQVLLIWQTRTPSGGYQIDTVGVDQPEDELIHAYTCMYHNGGANGDVDTPYNVLIRVNVSQQPQRAKLSHRKGSASDDSHETTTYEDSGDVPSLEPRELPDKPDTLTNESVVEFVQEYEEVHAYNAELTNDTIKLTIGCGAGLDFKTKEGYYIFTICRGNLKLNKDGHQPVGTLGPMPVFYFVSPETTERIGDHDSDSGPAYGNGQGGRESQGFRLVNFEETSHNVKITLTHNESPENDTVLETDYSMGATSAVNTSSVTAKEGTYELVVDLDTGVSTTYTWDIERIRPPYGFNIYITRTGEIRFGTNSNLRDV